MHLSSRARRVTTSGTLAIGNRVAELRAQGIDVINLGKGEPDFATPAHIVEACCQALHDGQTFYPKPGSGIPAARKAIRERFERVNGLSYAAEQVMATAGGKEAIALAMECVLDPGDEVVFAAPYWTSYPQLASLNEARAVVIPTNMESGFKIRPEQLAEAVTDRTALVIFNYPSNPTGATYSESELRALAEVLAPYELIVVSDEIYDEFVFNNHRHVSFAALDEAMYERTITVNAASKPYAMTGWRAGYAAGPKELISGMARLQSQTTTGVATFTQHALAAALAGQQDCVRQMREQCDRSRRRMLERLGRLKGVSFVEPVGAFYCFPRVAETYARLGVSNSVEFTNLLIEKARVAVVPGEAFGCDENVRMSFACSTEELDKALDRIEQVVGVE
jgi:aspartate aminotransferase